MDNQKPIFKRLKWRRFGSLTVFNGTRAFPAKLGHGPAKAPHLPSRGEHAKPHNGKEAFGVLVESAGASAKF